MNKLLIPMAALLVAGCSSSGGGSGVWRGGPWKDANIANLEVNLVRAGYPKQRAQEYRLSAAAEAGIARDGSGAWHNGRYFAYNQRQGPRRHHTVYVVDPNLMDRDTPPSNVIRHEQLHSVIESSPDHGGAPLPAELRRGGDYGHPREIFLNGRWHRCADLCQDRWPKRFGNWLLRRDPEPIKCGVPGDPANWQ